MYDKTKAQLMRQLEEITVAVDAMEETLESKVAILNDATRLAVVEELLTKAKQRLADANYDLAQTDGYGQPPNFGPLDLVRLDNDVVHLERLVTAARFAVAHGK